MTDTPHTDAAIGRCDPNGEASMVEACFARTIERALNAARARIAALEAERDRLRYALTRICWFDWSLNDSDAVAAIDVGRAALAGEEKP